MLLLNETAFNTLFREWYPVLCHFAVQYVQRRETAEDLVQEVFANLWSNRGSIEINKSISAYLYTATKHSCYYELKKRISETKIIEAHIEKSMPDHDEEADYQQFIKIKALFDAVENLPPKIKQVFMLTKIEGLTIEEAANYLGVSVKTVEKQISAAYQKLRLGLKTKRESN